MAVLKNTGVSKWRDSKISEPVRQETAGNLFSHKQWSVCKTLKCLLKFQIKYWYSIQQERSHCMRRCT